MTPEAWFEHGRFASLAGHRIFYVDSAPDAASLPVLLLLHGFPTSSWDWHRVWPDLSRDHRLVAFDFLGFGFSDKPKYHRYSILEQADIFDALTDELGLRRFAVLAHDYGDTVAQELLARDNARPSSERQWTSVCFLNGGLFPETHRARPIQKLLASPLGAILSRLLGKRAFERSFSGIFGAESQPSSEDLDGFWRLICHNDGRPIFHRALTYMAERRVHRERWVTALIDAHCPVQLINGSMDPISGAHMVARYRALVRSGDPITELPHVGHYPQVEAPEAVLKAYRAFIGSSLEVLEKGRP